MGFLDEILKKDQEEPKEEGDAREEPREEPREDSREESREDSREGKPSRSVFSYGEEFMKRYGA